MLELSRSDHTHWELHALLLVEQWCGFLNERGETGPPLYVVTEPRKGLISTYNDDDDDDDDNITHPFLLLSRRVLNALQCRSLILQ